MRRELPRTVRDEWNARIEALKDAFYLDRAERIARSADPEQELVAVSFRDACRTLAEPRVMALLLDGEDPGPGPTDPEAFVDAWAEAIRTNRGYLERLGGA